MVSFIPTDCYLPNKFNNGYIEGVNNTIKLLKRNSFWFKRLE
nr:transposase [Virgibacillus pantothenticus]